MVFKKGEISWNKGKSSWSKGKHFSKEHKDKIAKSLRGNTNGSGCKGIVKSEEMKDKIRKGVLNHYKNHPETIKKIKNARKYQKTVYESKHEKLIQSELNKKGIHFRKHRYMTEIKHGYQCDIFIEPNIVIEIDGDYWHSKPDRIKKDNIRNVELAEKGFKVFRIKALSFMDKNYRINQEVLDKFMEVIENATKTIHVYN